MLKPTTRDLLGVLTDLSILRLKLMDQAALRFQKKFGGDSEDYVPSDPTDDVLREFIQRSPQRLRDSGFLPSADVSPQRALRFARTQFEHWLRHESKSTPDEVWSVVIEEVFPGFGRVLRGCASEAGRARRRQRNHRLQPPGYSTLVWDAIAALATNPRQKRPFFLGIDGTPHLDHFGLRATMNADEWGLRPRTTKKDGTPRRVASLPENAPIPDHEPDPVECARVAEEARMIREVLDDFGARSIENSAAVERLINGGTRIDIAEKFEVKPKALIRAEERLAPLVAALRSRLAG